MLLAPAGFAVFKSRRGRGKGTERAGRARMPAASPTGMMMVPFYGGKQFHYPPHGEKTRFGPKAAARPVMMMMVLGGRCRWQATAAGRRACSPQAARAPGLPAVAGAALAQDPPFFVASLARRLNPSSPSGAAYCAHTPAAVLTPRSSSVPDFYQKDVD